MQGWTWGGTFLNPWVGQGRPTNGSVGESRGGYRGGCQRESMEDSRVDTRMGCKG